MSSSILPKPKVSRRGRSIKPRSQEDIITKSYSYKLKYPNIQFENNLPQYEEIEKRNISLGNEKTREVSILGEEVKLELHGDDEDDEDDCATLKISADDEAVIVETESKLEVSCEELKINLDDDEDLGSLKLSADEGEIKIETNQDLLVKSEEGMITVDASGSLNIKSHTLAGGDGINLIADQDINLLTGTTGVAGGKTLTLQSDKLTINVNSFNLDAASTSLEDAGSNKYLRLTIGSYVYRIFLENIS